MIQRIQSLHLILAVIFTAATYFTPLWDRLVEDPAAWILSGFLAATAFSIGFSLFAILKFTNRPAQVQWINRAMVFQIIAIAVSVAVFFTLGHIGSNLLSETIAVFMLVIALVFQFVARRAIVADEKLVKSIDRIR